VRPVHHLRDHLPGCSTVRSGVANGFRSRHSMNASCCRCPGRGTGQQSTDRAWPTRATRQGNFARITAENDEHRRTAADHHQSTVTRGHDVKHQPESDRLVRGLARDHLIRVHGLRHVATGSRLCR
jgi:hypothetical protein